MRTNKTISNILATAMAITAVSPVVTANAADLTAKPRHHARAEPVCVPAKTAQQLADETTIDNSVGEEHRSILGSTITDTKKITIAETNNIYQVVNKNGEVLDCVAGNTQRSLGVETGHAVAPGFLATIVPVIGDAVLGGGIAWAGALTRPSTTNVAGSSASATGGTGLGGAGGAGGAGGKSFSFSTSASSSKSSSYSSSEANAKLYSNQTVNVKFQPPAPKMPSGNGWSTPMPKPGCGC